jgi:hypothetical protein
MLHPAIAVEPPQFSVVAVLVVEEAVNPVGTVGIEEQVPPPLLTPLHDSRENVSNRRNRVVAIDASTSGLGLLGLRLRAKPITKPGISSHTV